MYKPALMSSMRSYRWLWLYFLVGLYLNIQYVTAVWPSSDSSIIQLLGIFNCNLNITELASRSVHTRAMFLAAIFLSQKYNITIGGEFIGWRVVKTEGDAMDALSSTCLEISNSSIAGIVGPTFSREAHVIAPFAAKLGIPVISYAATDPALSDRKVYPTFYRTVPSDNTAALAIAKLFMKFNWTSCIIIYQNDEFGSGGSQAIIDKFGENNLTIAELIVFDVVTQSIRGDLRSLLHSSPTRMVILWAELSYTSLILQQALDCDVLGPHFTWILSSNIPLNSFNSTWKKKLIGMLTVEPVVGNAIKAPINTTLLNEAYDIWQKYERQSFPGPDKIDSYALFAFDATWSLIQALKQLCSTDIDHSPSSCVSFVNTSFCFNRHFLNSSSFLNIINGNSFLGVSGPVEFSTDVTDRINGIYYVVKNVQSISNDLNDISVLVWSDSAGSTSYIHTNTIIWPGESLTAPTGYATVSGVTLRIAIIEAAPFTMIKEVKDKHGQITKKPVGYVPDLIEHLQEKMGFIPIITSLPSNYSYNGLIDAVANNVYDMVIGDVTILAVRRERVSFSSPIFENSLRIIIRDTSSDNIDFLSYLKPFSNIVWLIILSIVLWSSFLIYLFERENEAMIERSLISRIGMSMWYSIGTVVGYGVDFHVKTGAGRLLVVGIYFLSLVLIATYTANLTSNLTISKSQGIISGIDDIKNGKLSFSRIGILVDSSIEDYYLREISDGSRNFYPLKSKEEMYNKLLSNTIDAAIMDAGVLEYTTSGVYCNLTLVGRDFDHSVFGIVFPKDWLYEQVLDVNILSLREEGVFNNLKNQWFESNFCSRSSETSIELSIQQMAGIFLTFGIISILSVLLFIWLKRSKIRTCKSKPVQQNVPSINGSIQTRSNSLRTESHDTVDTYF